MKLPSEEFIRAVAAGQALVPYAECLCDWYRQNARDLPWRRDASPYHVWISEIMLQQTRIEAVLPHYESFLQAFPDVFALASVPSDVLMKQWEGLGYYSRARNLQKAAQYIVRNYNGEIPADYDLLLALPGIGEYTAGAIASIAFGIPAVAVDGNVLRVLARLTGECADVLSNEGKAWFTVVAQSALPVNMPGVFNSALMELGERVCLPNTLPKCQECPIKNGCSAYASGNQNQLPVRIRKTKRRIEYKTIVVLIEKKKDGARVLLHRRPDNGLLAGLWELPNFDGILSREDVENLVHALGGNIKKVFALPKGKHIFTHIEWRMSGWCAVLEEPVDYPQGEWATGEECGERYALPSAFRTYSSLLPILTEEDYA